jgi:hypothetical protein
MTLQEGAFCISAAGAEIRMGAISIAGGPNPDFEIRTS